MVPTVFNAGMQMFQNNTNYQRYLEAQERANQFARDERIAAQNYNSLENQYSQMQRVGMNPNLLQGQDFLSTQTYHSAFYPNIILKINLINIWILPPPLYLWKIILNFRKLNKTSRL